MKIVDGGNVRSAEYRPGTGLAAAVAGRSRIHLYARGRRVAVSKNMVRTRRNGRDASAIGEGHLRKGTASSLVVDRPSQNDRRS